MCSVSNKSLLYGKAIKFIRSTGKYAGIVLSVRSLNGDFMPLETGTAPGERR
jgi:hypothetical protein